MAVVPAVTIVINETASRLTLTNTDGEQLVLAPLEEKMIPAGSGFYFEELERKGIVRTLAEAPSSLGENLFTVVFGGGFWLVIGASVLTRVDPKFGISATNWPIVVWVAALLVMSVVIAVMIIRGTNSLSLAVRWTMNAVALTVILAIGLGLPATTIYYFGGGSELLRVAQAGNSESSLALFARLMQLALITTACMLPVLLYFLFDRYKLSTLRRRLYASLFRLDRSLNTVNEIRAKYGSQIGEAYGSDAQDHGRLTPGTRWPVLVCAFIMTLGWIIALAPVGAGFAPDDATKVLASLLPQQSVVVFGFLGVYFFSLRVIALRYARGDLKPKAYTNIMVRLLIVLVLSWVLDAIFPGAAELKLLLAFLFGITPDEFFTWIRQVFREKVPASAVPQSALPLGALEGIDLYDLARLESEGIVNIEGLAHHELFDLIIETRIPVPRLIDWIDQAILYLHLGDSDDKSRIKLRSYGIRTATDLESAWEGSKVRTELEDFKKLLGEERPYRLEVIRDALKDDEWFETVACWRRDEGHPERKELAAPTTTAALEEMADKEYEAKRYDRALNLLEESLRKQDTAGVRRKIARIRATSPVSALRNAKDALDHVTHAIALAPNDWENLLELIQICLDMDDTERAEEICAEADKILENWPSENSSEKSKEKKRLADIRKRISDRRG